VKHWLLLLLFLLLLLPTAASAQTPVQGPIGNFAAASAMAINVVNAPGADIGAKINAANAANGNAVLFVPALPASLSLSNCYLYSTPIVIANPAMLTSLGTGTTCLLYTGATGVAYTCNGAAFNSGCGLEGIKILGPGVANTATGIQLNAANFTCRNSSVGGYAFGGSGAYGFNLGITFGSNAYLINLGDCKFTTNTQELYYPNGLTNSGENIKIIAGNYVGLPGVTTATNCIQIGSSISNALGPDMTWIAPSIDTNCSMSVANSFVHMVSPHFEDGSTLAAPFLTVYGSATFGGRWGPQVTLDSPVFINDVAPGPGVASLIECDFFCSLTLNDIGDLGATAVPLVNMVPATGTGSLTINSPANTRTEAQLYSISGGSGTAFLNIDTATVSIAMATGSHVFTTSAGGADYLKTGAVAAGNGALGLYGWTGSGNQMFGSVLGVRPGSLDFCAIANFPATSYSVFGTQATICNAHVSGAGVFQGAGIDNTPIGATTPAAANLAATTSTTETVNTSVLPGAGMQHHRGPVGCATAAAPAAACTSGPQSWAVAFPDTNYSVSCTLEGVTGQPHIVSVSKSAGGFTLTIAADTAAAATASYDCVAMHD